MQNDDLHALDNVDDPAMNMFFGTVVNDNLNFGSPLHLSQDAWMEGINTPELLDLLDGGGVAVEEECPHAPIVQEVNFSCV
jgi:hypothetical protein